MTTPTYAWHNGELVAWEDCVVHVRTQGAFWGANVFEGLRGYWTGHGVAIFRLEDHLARLRRSMKSLHMPARFPDSELALACHELVHANGYDEDVHLCVVAYFGMGPNFDPLSHTEDVGVHITCTRAPRSPRFHDGVRASISSWRRISDDAMPPRIKAGANYHNSRLAHHEAVRNGYDTTFLLNARGNVSEAPGACVAMVRDGRIVTPPGTSGVLEGITMATIEQVSPLPFERREIDRTELYVADEVFVCGTLAEVQPVISVDGIAIGDGVPGPVVRTLQARYDTVVRTPALETVA